MTLTDDKDFEDLIKRLSNEKVLNADPAEPITVKDISGNINRTRRVRFTGIDGRQNSVVVKVVPEGGRLERYPSVQFPEDRLTNEYHYARAIREAVANDGAEEKSMIAAWTPSVLYSQTDEDKDDIVRFIVMNDLFPSRPLRDIFLENAGIPDNPVKRAGGTLALTHSLTKSHADAVNNPSAATNRPFVLTMPFHQAAEIRDAWPENWRRELQNNFLSQYGRLADEAGRMLVRFKADPDPVLTHGDLHGDSLFMRGDNTVTAIDAELCDTGAAWFDTGTLAAHLKMLAAAANGDDLSGRFIDSYIETVQAYVPAFDAESFRRDTDRLAGFEIIRRLIGVANADFIDTPEAAESLLHEAARLIDDKQISQPKPGGPRP